MPRNTFLARCLTAAALLGALPGAALTSARAQGYPERPVRIVSVTSAGTGVDDYTRLLAKYLHQKTGQSFFVENRPGANTILAADYVAKAAPDGYTLLLASASTMSANPFLFRSLPYNPQRDFVPVARMSALPVALVVAASSPYRSVADLTSAARARPGQLNYGTSSAGYRVMLAAFNDVAGIRTVDVPYKAMSNLLPDLIGGTLDFTALEISAAVPLVASRKLRALAVLGDQRVPALADVPTIAETGMGAVSVVSWIGLFAPKGTPAPVVEKLQAWALEFATSPEAKQHYVQRGSTAYPASGAQLARIIVEDQGKWQQLIKMAGIQPE
ncbi:Bug family tripartite tricarboxylate transporter substrate binding protein [Cupriavidus alkaliphilus]|uniref:Bug family tripartite tricarboxylate transporter substrate binding protein n=1 Tax=Cupriavidus alkaliphilus TaxID=942866 RepID=UPI00161DB1B2|nr:tripartite tricarboxylate transporter substrate binding protein [Cupriavidus alkaliphilus]MBB3013279.1 tripartite-type tricarboxylate transporter receptor subunit TctC [Cupriavidus alkaliphilus]